MLEEYLKNIENESQDNLESRTKKQNKFNEKILKNIKIYEKKYGKRLNDPYVHLFKSIIWDIKDGSDIKNAEKRLKTIKKLIKYGKIYENKFGKEIRIAEPSGEIQTLLAIKKCIKENKDILDEVLYPGYKDGIMY